MEKKRKRTYLISGRTNSNKWISQGFFNSLARATIYFKQKRPRFKGLATIRTQMAEDLGNGMLCADAGNWETLYEFKCIKELQIIMDGLQNTNPT